MKRLLVWAMISLFALPVVAQNVTLKGRVLDSLNHPVRGVSVLAKGMKRGTETDASGNFTLQLKAAASYDLIFSAVGFKSAIVTTTARQDIQVVLAQDIITQEEVVVNVGYGTLRKREVSSSVSSITAKDIKDVPINNAAEALTGRLAGVQVTTSEGAPDADVKIKVRGGGSITQSNDPLYIVDGVQVENGLSTVSPQDIQSIDVLKDAAATAIYGARGANGVIIVTTKSAKAGKLSVNFNTAVGVKKLAGELDVLDPYEFVLWEYERTRSNPQDSASFAGRYGTTWDTLVNYKNARKVDWQKEVMGNTGIVTNNSIVLNGGTNLVSFTAGYTNNYEKAIVQNSKYQRHLFNAKLDFKPMKEMKIGLSGRYNNQNVTGAGVSDDKGSSYNRLRNSVKYRPYISNAADIVDDTEGDVGNVGNGLSLTNPIRLNNAEYRRKTTNSYNLTANISYNITKNISFKTTFGYESSEYVDRQFSDSLTSLSTLQGGRKPVVQLDTTKRTQFTNSNVLSFKLHNYKKKHDFDFILGEETVVAKYDYSSGMYRNFPNFISYTDAFKTTTQQGTYFAGYPIYRSSESSLLSFFSRVNYSYRKKYVATFNMRADGSSKFADGRRWGYFPSGSVAWRISKEKFMDKVKGITDLKLRLSVGTVGNNRINDYLFITTFASNPYYYGLNGQSQFGYSSTALVNDLTRWESTVSKNIGLDLSLFNDRFGFTVDLYENTVKDLLLSVPVASTYGYTTQIQNIGSSRNRGIEFQINAVPIKKKDFTWNVTLNLSSNQNKIVELGKNQVSIPGYSGWGVAGQLNDYVAKVGEPIGAMWGLVTDGFYKVADFDYNATTNVYTLKAGVVNNDRIIGTPQPGSIKFQDLNGDGIIDIDHDTKIIGNATPKFSGGINQQFNYKNWDMSIFLNFVYGNKILNANKIEFTNGYTPNSNLLGIMENRWRTVNAQGVVVTDPTELAALNANATIWKPITASGAFQLHSWAVEDGSFLRINNISIGYNFPAKFFKKLGAKKLRAYITGNNLAVFTKYTGYDPEVNVKKNNPFTPGVDYSAYPRSRMYMFGINATF